MRRCLSIIAILIALSAVFSRATTHFVALNSPNPTAPYTNWDTAAHVIQDAIDAAESGDTILVTNGLYNTGGHPVIETLTNRVAITKPLTVQSVNGPVVTIIEGYQVPGTTNGDGAVRCVYMTNNATLIGFTITHGATYTNADSFNDENVGGVMCANFTNSVLSNCTIIANSAYSECGGVLLGTLNNCIIANNSDSSEAGGTAYSTLNHCLVTNNCSASGIGGIEGNSGTIVPYDDEPSTSANYCTIACNSSATGPGGAVTTFLNNCLVTGNQPVGADYCRLYNCTVVSNSIGIQSGAALNCISYYNNNGNCPNVFLDHGCTTPLPQYGSGNITNEPLFADPAAGDFRLLPNSPCINSGDNNYLTVTNNFWETPDKFYFLFLTNDLDGSPRVAGSTVDIGAYEFQSPTSIISYAWLQQYGFPQDGSADSADPDGDGMNNWQEWRAGTIPTNAASMLQMLTPSIGSAGITLTWQSQTNITYFLQRSPALGAPFSTIRSNLLGQGGTTSYTDTNGISAGPCLYRVGVQ